MESYLKVKKISRIYFLSFFGGGPLCLEEKIMIDFVRDKSKPLVPGVQTCRASISQC